MPCCAQPPIPSHFLLLTLLLTQPEYLTPSHAIKAQAVSRQLLSLYTESDQHSNLHSSFG